MFLTPNSLCAFLKISVCSGRKWGASGHSGVHLFRWYLQAAHAWVVPPLRVIAGSQIWVRNGEKSKEVRIGRSPDVLFVCMRGLGGVNETK